MADGAIEVHPPSGGSAIERAEQSVASRFSRVMRASTSRYGVLTDPPIVAAATAVGVVALLTALQLGAPSIVVRIAQGLAALPLALAVVTSVALSGARRRVVAWLASVPFPVENLNAVLNGVGELLEVRFAESSPTSQELNPELDAVHTDVFVTRAEPGEKLAEIRIGVVDSKRNPAASNHARYVRLQQIVERVLVPLSRRHAILEVRVK